MACPMPTKKDQNDINKSSNKCTAGNNPCFWNILNPRKIFYYFFFSFIILFLNY